MSIINSSALLGAGADGYQISRSLRFNSADSAYLSRTPASTTNRRTWTWSGWVKRSNLGYHDIFSVSGTGAPLTEIYFNSSDQLQLYHWNGSSADCNYATTQVFRDASAWYHIVIAVDTTNGTSGDRQKLYVNGTQVTAFSTSTAFSLNFDTAVNSSSYSHTIGRTTFGGGSGYFNGYLTEINFIDGQALTPSSFGETDTITGVWKPKKYAGTYGTNGFYLNFSDNSGTTSTTLGKDSSGNGNNWTPNNFSVTAGAGNDSMIDTPTPYADGGNGRGNYCTLNPLDATLTLSNGNLDWSAPSSVERGARGTFAVSSGKWYFEYIAKGSTFELVGWAAQTQNNNSTMPTGVGASTWAYYLFDLKTYNNATASAVYGTTASSGDIIMVALDLDNSKIYWGRNGTWFNSGNPATGTNAAYTNVSGTLFPWVQQYNQTSSINFGQRPFAYTPPSGFVALNTQNLPEPSIKKPSLWMDVSLWSGTSASQTIVNSGFQPDLVWTKNRNGANPNLLNDSVRGITTYLQSNATSAEATDATSFTSFNSNGFTLGANTAGGWNTSGLTYVGWQWKESATPGFDIVTYTAGSAGTVAHNLGVAPKMILLKDRTTAANWYVWHTTLAANQFLLLNSTAATGTSSTIWNNTLPTSTVFGTDNWGTDNMVAYLWSEVAGFSKFGSYTGNGSTDGPFVFCGFRPRWLLFKVTSTGYWGIYDAVRNTYNTLTSALYPNDSLAEGSDQPFDFLSNGFKVRGTTTFVNSNGATYIYAAFAEAPFKYALAR